MRIAIASGKGGTGKTTVATNLAAVLAEDGRRVAYYDCDVEEPDGHIFLKPDITDRHPVHMLVPKVNMETCCFCGICAEICRFRALAVLPDNVLVFPELCHGCGACTMLCPMRSIEESPRSIGTVSIGSGQGVRFIEGRLDVGEAQAPPVIKAVKEVPSADAEIRILDAPPGTSCPAMETVRGCDFVVLVTDSTPFGLHDLQLAAEMVRALGLPQAVLINRSDGHDNDVVNFCTAHDMEILARIPDSRDTAVTYSRGEMPALNDQLYREAILKLFQAVMRRAVA